MKKKIVLAFSGGLDTSFCIPYLLDKGFEVHTIFVNTGTSAIDEEKLSKRAIFDNSHPATIKFFTAVSTQLAAMS